MKKVTSSAGSISFRVAGLGRITCRRDEGPRLRRRLCIRAERGRQRGGNRSWEGSGYLQRKPPVLLSFASPLLLPQTSFHFPDSKTLPALEVDVAPTAQGGVSCLTNSNRSQLIQNCLSSLMTMAIAKDSKVLGKCCQGGKDVVRRYPFFTLLSGL